jgi:hypothetical protein
VNRRRTVEDRAADREVARALRRAGGAVTVADVVVSAALPEKVVERSLERLLDTHDGTVGVAKGGALIYRFRLGPFGLRVRRERRVLLRAAIRALATVTTGAVTATRAAFRALLAIQLLVYLMLILAPVSVVIGAVVGVVLAIFLVIVAVSEGGGVLELLFNPYVAGVFLAGCVLYGIYRVFKAKVHWLMAIAGRDERGEKGLAGFISQVNDFALGPEQPPGVRERIDRAWAVSQADERIVLARVRRREGLLRAGDLVAWLGLDLEEADRQATRICVEYNGEPTAVPDVEVVEFEMKGLLATAGGDAAEDGETTHERGAPLPRLTANTGREDAVIAGFAVLNGAAGAVGWQLLSGRGDGWWTAASIAGGALPLGFAALLFALLLARVPPFLVRRALARRRRLAAALHDAIVAHCRSRREAPLDLDALAREHAATPARVREVALRLGGAFDLDAADDPGKTVWRFRRLARELRSVEE